MAYEVPGIGMGMGPGGEYVAMQQATSFTPHKGVVYLQPQQPPQQQQQQQLVPGGVRLVLQQQQQQQMVQQAQLLAPSGGQQHVWVQAAPQQVHHQQHMLQVAGLPRTQPQFVQLQPPPQQTGPAPQQIVYVQQQMATPAPGPLLRPMPQVVQHQAPTQQPAPTPAGQPAPGSTVLVNINGTLRQAVVGQNRALFLMDSAKPAAAAAPMAQPQPQASMQPVPQAVQYVTMQASAPQQGGGPAGQQYVAVQPQARLGGAMQGVPMALRPAGAAMQMAPAQYLSTQPAPAQPGGQHMLLATSSGMPQQHAPQILQQRPAALQLVNGQIVAATSRPMAAAQHANGGLGPVGGMLMPLQQQGPGAVASAGTPVSAATTFIGGGGAAPRPPGLPMVSVPPSSSGLDLVALQAQVAQAQAQAAHQAQQKQQQQQQQLQAASVGVIGDSRRSRTGSSPHSP
ncbi:hypothetical protein MNEG_3621, partial [Monoraphidium neglectum]